MEPALSTPSAPPPVSLIGPLSENPRPDFERKNPALYPVHEVCNSTTAISLRAGLFLNGFRQSERARYYASTMGRFLSPDWAIKVTPVPYAKLRNPQTLNLYAYVLDNPMSYRDADGHWIQLNGNDAQRKKELAALKAAVGSKAGAYLYDNTYKGKHYVGILSVSVV